MIELNRSPIHTVVRRRPLSDAGPHSTSIVSAARAAAFAAVLVPLGCSADAESEGPMELEGRTLEPVGSVAEPHPDADDATLESMLASRTRMAEPEEPLTTRLWTDFKRDQLAADLRMVVAGRDNQLYLETEPNFELADSLLSGPPGIERDVRPLPGTEHREEQASSDDIGQVQQPIIFGVDNRGYNSNTTGPLWNSVARIVAFSPTTVSACTAFYIGPWTLVTAAHCLVFGNSNRANRLTVEPARNGSDLPFGSFECRNDDSVSGNDVMWMAPSGYISGQNSNFDYAVIDTWPCHKAPAWFPGYRENEGDRGYFAVGYAGDRCPSAPGGGLYQCFSSGATNVSGSFFESSTLDIVEAQSGAPLLTPFNGTNLPVGLFSHYAEYFDLGKCGFDKCRRNRFIRIDSSVSSFIRGASFDY